MICLWNIVDNYYKIAREKKENNHFVLEMRNSVLDNKEKTQMKFVIGQEVHSMWTTARSKASWPLKTQEDVLRNFFGDVEPIRQSEISFAYATVNIALINHWISDRATSCWNIVCLV